MANQVSLMAYLQHGPQAITVVDQGQSPNNTRNPSYSARDITFIGQWTGFNLASLQQRFGLLLQLAQIADEPFPTTPPKPINSEMILQARVHQYISSRITRALRSGFQHLEAVQQMAGHTRVDFDAGTAAQTIDAFTPDLAFFDLSLPERTRPNRLPGDIKPSFKWSTNLQNVNSEPAQREFRQALAQVNFYMFIHHARYGFILTDRELVAIRRLDDNGNLELAPSIPWTAHGTEAQPQMTVLLGLWYLGMLASDNQGWHF